MPRFLSEISNENWFRACGVAMAREQADIQEVLSVVLQKLSRVRYTLCYMPMDANGFHSSNRRLFEAADLIGTLMQLERTTQREFLKMNLKSILKV